MYPLVVGLVVGNFGKTNPAPPRADRHKLEPW